MATTPEEWTSPTSTEVRAVCDRLEAIHALLQAIEQHQRQQARYIGQAVQDVDPGD
ncbi:hypothetical protein [Microbacterium album]|uniref:Uncharacterized protein n=1 Tax=Microbacterium album TaxID=2053191 RepID=A0A917IC53_9MICO|nr:hypothetical protein [Microbacterium album]GGH34367.1 hypothetical protein GCM10010921_02020 [Microbacterium album]